MDLSMTRRRLVGFAASAVAAVGLTLAIAPAAHAATLEGYDLSTYSTGDLDQHVVLTLDYDGTVGIAEPDSVMYGMTVKIAGYDITSESYYRPVTVSADADKLVLDIGNVENGEGPAFTAIYGGVIDVDGAPVGVTVDGVAVPAVDIYTVIPTGVHVSMTSGQGTNSLSATVDHAANVRAMVHVALYNGETGSMVPVNVATDAGNLGVGTYNTHAHKFTTLVEADFAASIAALSLPDGYDIVADGANLTVTGPEGSQLYLYIFDDSMLQDLGMTFSGIVSNKGVMTDFLPNAQ